MQVAPGAPQIMSNKPTWHASNIFAAEFYTNDFPSGFDRDCVQGQNMSSQIGPWFDKFCEWMVAVKPQHACALASHGKKMDYLVSVSRHGRSGERKRQSGNSIATSWYTAEFWSTTPAVLVSCTSFAFSWYVGDAGNTSLVDAGTPLGATAVVTPRSAGYLLWECCILASL